MLLKLCPYFCSSAAVSPAAITASIHESCSRRLSLSIRRFSAATPKVSGRDGHAGIIKARFTITKNGKAKNIILDDESLGTDKLDNCLAEEILKMTFPKPKGGIEVPVTYPFKFEADNSLTQASIMDVLKTVDTTACFKEISDAKSLRVKLTISRAGKVQRSAVAFDNTDLRMSSPCLAKALQKPKFQKIGSKQFNSVSVVVTFEADAEQKVSQAR